MKNLMKNLKTYGLLTILMVAGLVISFSAFKAKEVNSTPHSYYFKGTSLLEMRDLDSWSDSPVASCGDDGSLPCEIQIPSNQSLNQYLSPLTDAQIVQAAITRKD